ASTLFPANPLPVEPEASTDRTTRQYRSEPPPPASKLQPNKELTFKNKQDPKDFDSIVELGNINFDQKNYDDAINLFKKALEIHPDSLGVRTDMGTAMLFLKRFDEAIATFQGSLQTAPNDAETLLYLGVAMLHGKSAPQSALQYWEKLVETNPNHPKAAFVREQIKKLKEQQSKP